MPAAAIASIALVSVLPGPGAIALVAIQMIGSANPVIDLYDTRHDWRLRGIPLRAALRLDNEQDYLRQNIGDFANDRTIEDLTRRSARVFALAPVHQAYLEREVLVYWHSSLADRIIDLLALAQDSPGMPAARLSWTWPAGMYRSVRLTAASDMRILQAQLEPGALAVNTALSWTPWKAGEPFDFRAPPGVTGADLLIWPETTSLRMAQAQTLTGEWLPIGGSVRKSSVPVDIRREAAAFIRRSGYRYILVSTGKGAFSRIGKDLLEHPVEWGVEQAGRNGDVWLLYISGGPA